MAKPGSGQQMAQDYASGVAGVTMQEYCSRQEELGVRRDVCERRFQRYKARVSQPGTASKFLERYQNS